MREDLKIPVLISYVDRLRFSGVKGNPLWILVTDKGKYKTAVDSQCAYLLHERIKNVRANLFFDKRGEVCRIEVDPRDW